jgi:hypothetical protein
VQDADNIWCHVLRPIALFQTRTAREAKAYFDLTSPENPATARRLKAQPMTDRK